ncbi:hypothetical protein F7725_011564 [Dissostichus mawsoni]|uniref:Phospholipid scramblase n=1 Tax=Dissostichus mawsoni TaxID=36200 RepID=A0A7J5Z9Y9_DISMA|nr:hypothetical protein F7725_011564 [Dissostichus mawsoni]
MSAVTNQPLPFGQLEREKHIQMIFKAFQKQCGPSCECHTHSTGPKRTQTPPDCESDGQLSGVAPGRMMKNGFMQQPGKVSLPGVEEPGGAAGSHFLSVLETCCGPARACSLRGFDCQGRQVFYFERPLRVDACCLGCCLMEMRAYTPHKQLIGTVFQRWSMFTPLLEIVSNIGEKMGSIWKKWPGFNDDYNMDHEYFGLEVPLGMESHSKLMLLAATFLLKGQ